MSILYTNRGHFYTPHTRPVLLDCNFAVDVANGNGLGIRSLKGQGIKNVFMNSTAAFTGTVTSSSNIITGISPITSSAPLLVGMPIQGSDIPAGTTITAILSSTSVQMSQNATGSPGSGSITYQAPGNPNPPAGIIYVEFADNFNRYYGGFGGFNSPLSGSAIDVSTTGTTANLTYVIVVLGTVTLAGWQSLGLPPGIVPAVGVSFTATATATAAGSGYVEVIAAAGSGLNHIEVIGDPNTTINPIPMGGSPNFGGYLYMACFGSVGSSGVNAIAAPAVGTYIGLAFYLGQSSVSVAGE